MPHTDIPCGASNYPPIPIVVLTLALHFTLFIEQIYADFRKKHRNGHFTRRGSY